MNKTLKTLTFFDLNGVWSEVIKALRLMRYFDYNLEKKLGGWLHIRGRTSYVEFSYPASSYALIGQEQPYSRRTFGTT